MSKLEELAEAIVFAHEPDQTNAAETTESRDLERIAALAAGAFSHAAPAPSSLASKLAADALAFCAAQKAPAPQEPPGFTTPRPGQGGRILSFVLGAAAASMLLWFTVLSPYEETLSEMRAEALANQVAMQQQWKPGPSPLRGDVTGDVVWRQNEQDGWLTFRNLPVLPADKAYQLWIVDGERDGAPVDGGVFTIASEDRETIVPIQARLPIGKPAAFVITVEDRNGVVVSKQEHVVAIAAL
jgi:hypothetical protein